MEKLVSHQGQMQSVPQSYVLPQEKRPGNFVVPLCTTFPVIDLQGNNVHDRGELVQKIMKASQEFGFFQLINHGVPEELMLDVLGVAKEFFALPAEDKASFYSEDSKQKCRLSTSIDYFNENVHFWRDNLRHPCHPPEDNVKDWPLNPPRYREVAREYAVEVRKLSLLLLDLIWQGLGIDSRNLESGLCGVQIMTLNHYPPCPDPSLTLGLPKHSDVSLITILNQGDIPGLQVLKNDQWFAVKPLPGAFVVNVGLMVQIISNGKVRSADHRVVTNSRVARTTVASLINPSADCHVAPAEVLVNKSNPCLYRSFVYKDFQSSYITDVYEGRPTLARYEISS